MEQNETDDRGLRSDALLSDALKDTGFEVCEWEPDDTACEKCGKSHVQMYFGNHSYWDCREGDYWCESCVVELFHANKTLG